MSTFLRSILPASQRRDLGDLAEKLDLGAGDRQAKSSAFWTMLTLSAIIAVAGLLADSTATVIGAMIIAPLSVPIMGMAVGIVRAGTLVFSAYGYGAEARAGGFRRRRAYSMVGVGLVLVLIPLVANTVANVLVEVWTQRVADAAEAWVADVPGARVTDVTVVSRTAIIQVEAPDHLPDVEALLADLDGKVPDGVRVVVDAGLGERIDAGVVGSPGAG